ncbi:hypothetical protein KIMC2_05560 [Xylocopilactobacillus apis]|uniref:Uncharacterized protein n=1 Tax=Xylocopilactobacillus apis TaxID=2932183 RepID=A0AAU9CPX5_9LACO|nr:hypothetical protein KIMC2_05560 [Xylocopilactobacillus apis]
MIEFNLKISEIVTLAVVVIGIVLQVIIEFMYIFTLTAIKVTLPNNQTIFWATIHSVT